MSRIGKKPITIPSGVEVNISGHVVSVKGPQGSLKRELPHEVKIAKDKDHLVCSIANTEEKRLKSLYGLVRSLVANMVQGVAKGYSRELEVVGNGYKVKQEGTKIVFNIGYSHPVAVEAPKDIKFKLEGMKLTVSGPDKELVGQVAANIRAIKPPSPYKGVGIRYSNEKVRIKEGKKLAA